MFTPTKQELEELGFKQGEHLFYREQRFSFLYYLPNCNEIRMSFGGQMMFQAYPQSLEDLKTLIRLLTPPGA